MAEDSLQPLIPQVRVHKKIRLDTVKLHILVKENKYSVVSIKNIDILPNRQYIANTADSAQEQYS